MADFGHGLLFTERKLRREQSDIQPHRRPDKLGSRDNEKQMWPQGLVKSLYDTVKTVSGTVMHAG